MKFTIETMALLDKIANKKFYRNDVAKLYSTFISNHKVVNWEVVNKAIIKRWSDSGLKYIKNKAWKVE